MSLTNPNSSASVGNVLAHLKIVMEVAGRHALLIGIGLQVELIPRPGGPTAQVVFGDMSHRYWEVSLDGIESPLAFRELVEAQILAFRPPVYAAPGAAEHQNRSVGREAGGRSLSTE
jgi:hypothetical protein